MKKGGGIKRIAFEISVLVSLAIVLPLSAIVVLFYVIKEVFTRVPRSITNCLEELFYGKENTNM